MHHEHAITYRENINISELDYLIKKANRLGKNGRDVICVFEQEDEEGTHLFFEVTGFKPKAPIQC